MQNTITTQFSNLGIVLLQNIQHAQVSMHEVVATPAPIPQSPFALVPFDPPPPPSQPPPSFSAQD
ncbi:hypothetical protein HKD37_09G025329 [Glycine soja]